MRALFTKSALILDSLTIAQLASAQARLSVFVSNDTGPMHIAAAVGSPVVLLLDKRAPESYLPRAQRQRVIYSSTICEITVAEVYAATEELLAGIRAETLFAS
jgi:ADP-heptose:LPS heptosyltransferase